MTSEALFREFCKAYPALYEGAKAYSTVRSDPKSIVVTMKSGAVHKFTVDKKEYILKTERRTVK